MKLIKPRKKTKFVNPSNIVVPSLVVPPKSADTKSAFDLILDDDIKERLDKVRVLHAKQGMQHLARLDAAICFLKLDMGYPDDEFLEVLTEGIDQIVKEAQALQKK